MLAAAAATGNRDDTCEVLAFQSSCPWGACISWRAAGHEQLAVLQWAKSVEDEYNMGARASVTQPSELLAAACTGGHPYVFTHALAAWHEHQQMNEDPIYSTAGESELTAFSVVWAAAIPGYGDFSGAIGAPSHGGSGSASGRSSGDAAGAGSGIHCGARAGCRRRRGWRWGVRCSAGQQFSGSCGRGRGASRS